MQRERRVQRNPKEPVLPGIQVRSPMNCGPECRATGQPLPEDGQWQGKGAAPSARWKELLRQGADHPGGEPSSLPVVSAGSCHAAPSAPLAPGLLMPSFLPASDCWSDPCSL